MIKINKPLECDILIAGGGAGGMQAAIDGADAGASVIVAEKANTRRSGSGATGNDHFQCYIPEVHGDEETWINLLLNAQEARGGRDRDMIETLMHESFGLVLDWEKYGINMRPHGYWEFTGHCRPGLQGIHMKYAGVNQKPALTKQALLRGVKILNRHPLTEVITNKQGEVIGAILVDLTEEDPKLQVVRAKTVIIATAGSSRIAGEETMGWMFNQAGCPACTGGGIMAAYRAGARLVNMEGGAGGGMPSFKFFHRGGKATWVGVYTDIDGKPLGPFVTKPDWHYGDFTADFWPAMFEMQYKAGNPVFMNCSEGTDEDIDYMTWALVHEGNGATLQHLKDEGFDFRKHMVEFDYSKTGGLGKGNGIDANAYGETNVKGLYAAGNVVGNSIFGISPSATMGRLSSRRAAEYSRSKDFEPAEEADLVRETAERYTKLLENEVSPATPSWQEANIALMQTNWAYFGADVRSDRFLRIGLSHIRRIQAKLDQLHCSGSHEFMHCLEVQNLAQQSELNYIAARERKESRGNIKFVEYPFTNPDLDGKLATLQKIEGVPVTGFRSMVK